MNEFEFNLYLLMSLFFVNKRLINRSNSKISSQIGIFTILLAQLLLLRNQIFFLLNQILQIFLNLCFFSFNLTCLNLYLRSYLVICLPFIYTMLKILIIFNLRLYLSQFILKFINISLNLILLRDFDSLFRIKFV